LSTVAVLKSLPQPVVKLKYLKTFVLFACRAEALREGRCHLCQKLRIQNSKLRIVFLICGQNRSQESERDFMPIISRFFGIMIYMYWREHAPPHFHAKYQDDEVVVDIETGRVTGSMSARALRLIEEWRLLHVAELCREWELAEQNKELFRIDPLE
jgi:hypothetical protein